MSDYTPTTEQVENGFSHEPEYEDTDPVSYDEHVASNRRAFKRWLAEYTAERERAAAEKAWERCVAEMPIDLDWKNLYSDNNPYRLND